MPTNNTPRRVLLLMSDTGGGHRAAAEAIRDALIERHGDAVSVEMVDVFRAYAPFPFKYFPEMYPWTIKNGRLMWWLAYHMSDRRFQAGLMMGSIGRAIWRGLRRMLHDHKADVIVSVHPLFPMPALRILRKQATRPPFVTVVTDLVSTHAFWYEHGADRILVPTQPAYDRGIKFGVRPDQMRITGLPVHPRFSAGLSDALSKTDLRSRLGWDAELPTLLLVGGGEGMGPLYRIARRINELNAHCQLAIVAGRNKTLHGRLETATWNQPTHIYPFVTNMPELMCAADLLITKAGPATITEACIAGLPMILSDAIPGQEDGNVAYIRDHQAGVYAPGSRRVAKAVREWLDQGADFLHARAENARQLARRNAVWDIADEIWDQAQKPPIQQSAVSNQPSVVDKFKIHR